MWFIIYSNNVEKYQPFLENCKFKIHDLTFYGTLRDSWVMDSGVRDEGFGLRSNFNTDFKMGNGYVCFSNGYGCTGW